MITASLTVRIGPIVYKSKDVDMALGHKKPPMGFLGCFIRPTNAGLRKYLRTKSGTRKDRGQVWAWLQYRRQR